MKQTTLNQDLQEIKITLARIDEHLKNMNGKLLDCTHHNNVQCPKNRQDIYNKMDSIKTSTVSATAILGVLLTLMFFLLNKFWR